jgi:signal peptidase I
MKRVLFVLLVLLLLSAAAAKIVVFDFPRVSGNDMAPSVQKDDWLLVNRLDTEPNRGDLVLVEHPRRRFPVVRRVVGLPGETIVVKNETPIVNGKPATRKVLREVELTEAPGGRKVTLSMRMVREQLGNATYEVLKDPQRRSRDIKPVKLGSTSYFLMADNRNHGTDSRTFGPIEAKDVRGVVSRRMFAGEGCLGEKREGWTSLRQK